MRIPRVYVDDELSAGASIALAEAQSHYLKNVLRLKPGAALFLFNGREDRHYPAELYLDGKRFTANLGTGIDCQTDSQLDSEILQGLGRSDHTDWMIQKTTELGVRQIRLFPAERSQSRFKAKQLEKKQAQWRASEQSGRNRLPSIVFHDDLGQAMTNTQADAKFLLDFEGQPLVSSISEKMTAIALLIGPEGGLTAPEITAARDNGFRPTTLGPRVLRTETAAITALAIAQATAGDLGA